VSPLRDYWRINLGVVRLNFSWLHLRSYSWHLWVATWNSERGWTINVRGLLPDWLRALLPGRLFWQQRRGSRRAGGRR
jgi:hypothetical protein